jgi:predicted nucleic acid-binding protein
LTRLVVDASVVVKWFLPEVLAEAALRIAEGDHRFLAPELLGAEFTSALWKKSRRGEIDTAAAVRMLDDFSRIAIAFHPLTPLLPTAFAIAAAAGHSVYDCLYLALAEREDCPIVTADRRFYAAFAGGQLGHRMLWVDALR